MNIPNRLKNHIDLLFLSTISLCFFFLMSYDINSWYYSYIGDEYAIFDMGKNIITGKTSLSILPSPNTLSVLTQNGVYNHIPVLSTVIQAAPLKLLGIHHSAWIFGSILIVIISFWFFYFFVKNYLDQGIAMISIIIFALSHYLWAIIHTGYWNIQILLTHLATLCFLFGGEKKRQARFYFLAGICASLGFYTYYSARISVVLVTIFFLINYKKFLHHKKFPIAFFIGFLLLFLPFLFVNKNDLISSMVNQSVINSKEIPQIQKLEYVKNNIIDAFFSFYKNKYSHHFVSGSLIDPLTMIFVSLGSIGILYRWKKYYFLLIWLILLLIVLGGFSPYITTPITRLFFLLPVFSIIAAISIVRIIEFGEKYLSTKYILFIISILFSIIAFLNIFRFYIETPSKTDIKGEALIIGALTTLPSCKKEAIIFYPDDNSSLESALKSYNFSQPIQTIKEKNSLYPKTDSCIIFARPKENQSEELLNEYAQNGYKEFDFFTLSKNYFITIAEK